jgi:hypothetical protein
MKIAVAGCGIGAGGERVIPLSCCCYGYDMIGLIHWNGCRAKLLRNEPNFGLPLRPSANAHRARLIMHSGGKGQRLTTL